MASPNLLTTGLLASAAAGVVYRSARTIVQTRKIVPLAESSGSPVEPPRVTVVIPARNESAVLDDCLRGVLGQSHGTADQSLLRAVLVDDGSTDSTGDIARAHADRDPRLAVERVDAPPEGWSGKVHAMHAGVDRAAAPEAGEWLMFLDADTVPSPDLVSRLVATAESADADLVSSPGGPPTAHSTTWPLLMPSGLQMIGENADPNGRGRKAFAIGHCILVRRSHYEKVGGWRALADRRNEDIAIATLVRDGGGTTRTVDGLDHLTTSGMDPLGQGWSSFRKSFVAGTGGSAPLLAAIGVGQVAVSVAAPVAAITGISGGRRGLALLGAAGWLAQCAAHERTGRFMRAGRGVGALAPAGGVLFGGLLLDGALRARRGMTSWKGRRTST